MFIEAIAAVGVVAVLLSVSAAIHALRIFRFTANSAAMRGGSSSRPMPLRAAN